MPKPASKPERRIPPEEWIPHPVSDSSDYLDGDPPRYQQVDESQLPDDEATDG